VKRLESPFCRPRNRRSPKQLAPKPAAHSPSAAPNGLETCVWAKAGVRLAQRIANSEVCGLSVFSGFQWGLGSGEGGGSAPALAPKHARPRAQPRAAAHANAPPFSHAAGVCAARAGARGFENSVCFVRAEDPHRPLILTRAGRGVSARSAGCSPPPALGRGALRRVGGARRASRRVGAVFRA
jgi:hypothetical protein